MSLQHNTLKTVHSYQNSGFQSDKNEKKTEYRRTISYNDYHTLQIEGLPEQKVTSFSPPIIHVSIPIPEPTIPTVHREIKSGRQRFRWNLIFNVLVWIICPLPIWLTLVSHKLAIYILPSIQFIFTFMWFIISLLAARNAFLLFQLVFI